MRLWVRLAAVLAVVAVLPVVVIGWFAVDVATERALQDSKARLEREAVDQAEFVDRWVADQAEALLAKPGLFLGGGRFSSTETLQGFLRLVYLDVPSAVTVVMVDGDGLAVGQPVFQESDRGGRVPSSARRAQSLVERLPLGNVLEGETGVVHLGDPWLPEGPGTPPSLPLALRVVDAEDPVEQRILGVEVALDVADELVAGASADHAIVLLDASGAPLVGGEHPLVGGGVVGLLSPLLGGTADFTVDGPEGAILGSLTQLPVSQWTVVVAEPAAVVLAPAREIRRNLFVIVGGAVAVALVLAFALAGTVSRPVERLRDAVDRISEGTEGVQAGIERSDEIGDLARAFDHMSARLASSREEIEEQQQEIEAFNRELQDRVEERTRQLRDAQDQLVRSGQLAAVAEVGAGLAHELNNPLAAILGTAQLLKMRRAGTTDEALLADLEAQADRCRDVVAAMLKFASGEVDPASAPVVVVQDVLQDVVELVRGPFRQRGVELALEEATAPVQVRVDPVQGARIVAQVLGALRAGLPGGARVTVRTAPVDGDVRIELVADQPVGEDPARRDDWEASGLGLWVARQTLDRLGGRLEHDDDRAWTVVLPEA